MTTVFTTFAIIWFVLIGSWWVFWYFYGDGKLKPASWKAILTMPVWSLQSVYYGLKRRRAKAPTDTASKDPTHELLFHLRTLQKQPPTNLQVCKRTVVGLKEALRTAPEGTPDVLLEEMRRTIHQLEDL